MASGKFITFEGGEGAGKSTQATRLAERLQAKGLTVIETREPGGTKQAEKIRDFILSGKAKSYGALGEAILFSAARDDHLKNVIRPALERGDWVLCDRFSDSTLAYQGAAGGVKPSLIRALEKTTVGETKPDLTIILDLPPEVGMKRASERDGREPGDAANGADRFEAEEIRFHSALREGFLNIAEQEPQRCVVIDAQQPENAVTEKIWETVMERLEP